MNNQISLDTGNSTLNKAFKIALDDYASNIRPWCGPLQDSALDCIIAGEAYREPWTRDAALNSWFSANLMTPDIARNTLVSVLKRDQSGLRIGGQYWDAVIWVTAAWQHYLCTRDQAFLQTAFEASLNSIQFFEQTEFDVDLHLFRGGACFQDGVSGYPDMFAGGATSGILEWDGVERVPEGHGLPLMALSTNCLYYNAYRVLGLMAGGLGRTVGPDWAHKAQALKAAINAHFWDDRAGHYRYLTRHFDDITRQEGIGHAFAILFGVADKGQITRIVKNQHLTAHGIACVWPSYERYTDFGAGAFGRHAGTVWPHVNACWAMAMQKIGASDLVRREIDLLAGKALRDGEFVELYHPITGHAYGGIQETANGGPELVEWGVRHRQTWCATGFVGMILRHILGMQIGAEGLSFTPQLGPDDTYVHLKHLQYGKANVSVHASIEGYESHVSINGVSQTHAQISPMAEGQFDIQINVPQIVDQRSRQQAL